MFASTIGRRLLAAITLAGLAGCAGSGSTGAFAPAQGPLPPQAPAMRSTMVRQGVSPAAKPKDLRELYVSDYVDNVVKILKNGTWRDAGAIGAGLNWPAGLFLDKRGNLYVANTFGANVTEYAPRTTTPSFTYSANMVLPMFVTTDSHQNLFEGDSGNGTASGQVNEYFQGVNATVASCTPGPPSGNAGVYGVAVDAQGNVFVDFRLPGGISGSMVEYSGGLQGCHQTTLPLTFNGPTGMAIDANGNVVVAEAQGGVVDVIAPPYTSVSRTLYSGFGVPIDVKLSKDNAEAFVTDGQSNSVTIVNYQTGANIKTLGAAYGLSNVNGAVDGPNAIY